MRAQSGFSFIELLFVIAVIGILALMALPGMQANALKRQVREGLDLADIAKKGVQEYYSAKEEMPNNNKEAGIPPRDKIISSLVKDVHVQQGAITLTYGNNASKVLDGKKVTLRPAVVAGESKVPISWICAAVAAPKGMEIMGQNHTDIPMDQLPVECRSNASKK